jgi:hypothetical protein
MSNRKVRKPNVIRGGTAVPLGRNYYYMSGRKHETGGIDIGKNPRTGLEVEDGEVMHVGKNEIKVFSAQPFLNGKSPAQRVMQGDNPNAVFNAQERFKKRNKLNDDGTKKKRMGGLSRDKDYGSKSKPYPSVKSGDFAGGHRSYPIPTKADARDALRLAGLHGRSDVKAKVYRKYPELRKKARNGGLYSVTVNGITKLYPFPSTGGVRKSTTSKPAKTAKRSKYVTGGNKKINDQYTRPLNISDMNTFSSMEQVPNPFISEVTEDSNTNVPYAFARRNSDITDPEKLNIAYQKASGTYPNWFRRTYNAAKDYITKNPNTIDDAIGLVSNIGFSIAGRNTNNRMLDRMRYSPQPVARQAAKLKTRININPQLDKMRESLAEYERAIDNNTVSSSVALARKQRARLANILQTNELFGNKENLETELINKDRLNQQAVADANIRDYNTWSENKSAFRNAILNQKAENDISLFNNINAGVQDVIARREKRESESQTRKAMMAGYPNVNPRLLRTLGIKGISDEDIANWDKAYDKKYRRKIKGNNSED